MLRFAPATWPWLLRHELRLVWRRYSSAKRGRGRWIWLAVVAILGGLFWLGAHALVYFFLKRVDSRAAPPIAIVMLGIGTLLIFTLMLSQAILLAVDVLFDRGDFDLLLASPLRARVVFFVRGLGVACSVPLLYLVLLSPLADAGAASGNANLLAIYPTLIGLGFLAAALGMAATITLVRLLGARRARVAAQLLGALVGAAMFLASQAGNFIGRTNIDLGALVRHAGDDGWLGAASPLWLPVRAGLGEPAALLAVVGGSLLAFVLVVVFTARYFLAGAQESVTQTRRPPNLAEPGSSRFAHGLVKVVLIKEWRLLWRDPQLIAQTLLQTLYLLPIAFAWGRRGTAAAVLLPATVVAAASLASSLTWLTVAAEDALELVASAPVSLARVRAIKLLAALLPVWIFVLPWAGFIGHEDLFMVGVFVASVLGATGSAGLIQLQLASVGSRKDLRKRGKGNWVATLLEVLNTIAWGGVTGLALSAPAYAFLPGILAVAVPLAAVMLGRSRRRHADVVT